MNRRILRVLALVVAATLGAAGCDDTTSDANGRQLSLPNEVVVIVPTGSKVPDLGTLVDDGIRTVEVVAVDPAGVTQTVADIDLTGSGAANPDLARASRETARKQLNTVQIPDGEGYGDVLAGARKAAEKGGKKRVVTFGSGCLELAGARLTGADLTSDPAIKDAVDSLAAAGAVSYPTAATDVTVVIAGAGECADNSADAVARLKLFEALCEQATVPCVAREGRTLK